MKLLHLPLDLARGSPWKGPIDPDMNLPKDNPWNGRSGWKEISSHKTIDPKDCSLHLVRLNSNFPYRDRLALS